MTAYKRTSVYEGGYANDPADRGGETWKGIARNMHPHWSGWVIIDTFRPKQGFPENLKKVDVLEWSVQKFYQEKFWLPIWGDKIKDQDIANDIYDMAVNAGVQEAINIAEAASGMAKTGKMSQQLLDKLNNK